MTANINEDELKLLTYLHEHARGYDKHFRFNPEAITSALGFDKDGMRKHSSYLAAHDLIGQHIIESATFQSYTSIQAYLWLTGIGEDYMRALEEAPGVARKLTVGAVSELWAAGKGVIVGAAAQLLADFAKHYHRS